MDNLLNYLKITAAAHFLGVTSATLRNWERQGKLKAYRNPLNRYRLYKKEDLEKLLQRIKESQTVENII